MVFEEVGPELRGMRVFQGDPFRRVGAQVLRLNAGSEGHFDIISDSDHPGAKDGQVKITKNGRAYLFAWFEPRLTYSGTAVKIGKYFVVAFSSTNLPAVAALCRDGDVLSGVGVLNAGKSLTRELMAPVAPARLPADLQEATCTG